MDDYTTFIELVLKQGGGYALAGLMFLLYRKDVLRQVIDTKEEKAILIELVSEVKVALTELTILIRTKT